MLLDGIEGYQYMAQHYSYLYNWLTAHFYFLIANYLLRAILLKIRYTRRREQNCTIFLLLYCLVCFFYGWGILIVFKYTAVSHEYFSKPDTFIWHQYFTFKFIVYFRTPFIFYLTLVFCIVCCVMSQRRNRGRQGAGNADGEDSGAFGGIRRSTTAFWNKHSRPF